MKINLSIRFCSKITASLLILVFNVKTVCSSDGLSEKKLCRTTNKNACVIFCQDCNSEPKHGVGLLKEILKAEDKKFQNCSLILEGFTHAHSIWNQINPDDTPKIEDLTILHSVLDLNQLNLSIFKNLRRLTMKNTTTVGLRSEVFLHMPKLQKLQIKQHFIKWVDRGFLQNLFLEFIQIQSINLNRTKMSQFFKNLTAGFQIPRILNFQNQSTTLTKDLLTQQVNILIWTYYSGSPTDDKTFTNRSIDGIYINKNKAQKFFEKFFNRLAGKASLDGLICDCKIKRPKSFVKKRNYSQKIQITCSHSVGVQSADVETCPGMKEETPTVSCFPKNNSEISHNCNSIPNSIQFFSVLDNASNAFTITKEEPDLIEITISNTTAMEGLFFWYGEYKHAKPKFNCLKIQQNTFSFYVTPETNHLICLVTNYGKHSYCLPYKTKSLHENQTWLTNKSIPLSIVFIFVMLLFAAAMGALILYLSVRKNPSLIRGSKRVIEVKRHDKAQVLIMPRDYERSESQGEPSSLTLLNHSLPLEPTLSSDTISTVSYVSAHQPTQLEILTYRLNRLRELFRRNNNLPPPVPRMPMQTANPVNQRLPPDVDLLFEYEWYTITTTTTTEV